MRKGRKLRRSAAIRILILCFWIQFPIIQSEHNKFQMKTYCSCSASYWLFTAKCLGSVDIIGKSMLHLLLCICHLGVTRVPATPVLSQMERCLDLIPVIGGGKLISTYCLDLRVLHMRLEMWGSRSNSLNFYSVLPCRAWSLTGECCCCA